MHYASLTCNSTRPQHTFTEHIQSVLITGFKSLPGLPGVKGLIAAYIWRNPNSSNSHPHRVCNFRTLSSGSDSNADDQYSHLKRFIVRDLTDWANENYNIQQHIHNIVTITRAIAEISHTPLSKDLRILKLLPASFSTGNSKNMINLFFHPKGKEDMEIPNFFLYKKWEVPIV